MRLTLERAEPAPHGEVPLRPHQATHHGRQALADGPLPPGSIPGDVRNMRRLPCPPPALQPSHRNAQLGFPHPDAIKKFRMWLGEEGREVDLEGGGVLPGAHAGSAEAKAGSLSWFCPRLQGSWAK